MILKIIPRSRDDTVLVTKLPQPDMVVDPRARGFMDQYFKFEVSVNGRALTITRIEREKAD